MDDSTNYTVFGIPIETCLAHPLFRSAIRKVLEDNGKDPDEWDVLKLRKRGPRPGYKARLDAKKKAAKQAKRAERKAERERRTEDAD